MSKRRIFAANIAIRSGDYLKFREFTRSDASHLKSHFTTGLIVVTIGDINSLQNAYMGNMIKTRENKENWGMCEMQLG